MKDGIRIPITVTLVCTALVATGCGRKKKDQQAKPALEHVAEPTVSVAQAPPEEQQDTASQIVKEVQRKGVLETALKVGDPAPDFTLPMPQRKTVNLTQLLAQGPVVLVWYRGGWCPYCNKQLRSYQKHLKKFKALGAQLLAVSPEQPAKAEVTIAKNELGFHVASDIGNRAARKYGIVYQVPPDVVQQFEENNISLREYNLVDSKWLPLAATYVIGTDGIIHYAFVDADYQKRAEPSELLAALKKLKKKR